MTILISLIAFFAMIFGHNVDHSREDFWKLDNVTDSFLNYIKPAVITFGIVTVAGTVFLYSICDVSNEVSFIKRFFENLYINGILGAVIGFCFCGIPMAIKNIEKVVFISILMSLGFIPFFVVVPFVFVTSIFYYDFKILLMIIRDIFKMYKYSR